MLLALKTGGFALMVSEQGPATRPQPESCISYRFLGTLCGCMIYAYFVCKCAL